MNLVTDLSTTLEQYAALPGELGHKLAMNVSNEADVGFLSALKREDPERYHRLQRNLERAVGGARRRTRRAARHYKACPGCNRRFLPHRSDARTCSDACRKRVERRAPTGPVSHLAATCIGIAA